MWGVPLDCYVLAISEIRDKGSNGFWLSPFADRRILALTRFDIQYVHVSLFFQHDTGMELKVLYPFIQQVQNLLLFIRSHLTDSKAPKLPLLHTMDLGNRAARRLANERCNEFGTTLTKVAII